MNDLIAKLYDQAIVIKDGGDWTTGELDPVKFAELIVKECAGIAKIKVLGMSTFENAEYVEEKIKQHFGVRE